ncbi:MAG: EAL domain-containing protein [Pontibacterium sp.]
MISSFRSLQIKLLLVLISSVFAALLVSYIYSAQSASEQFDHKLNEIRKNLQRYPPILAGPVWNFDKSTVMSITHAIMVDPDILRVEILDEGTNLIHSERSEQLGLVNNAFTLNLPLIYSNAHFSQRTGTLKVIVGNSTLLADQARFFKETLLSLLLVISTLLASLSIAYYRLLDRPIKSLMSAINSSKKRMVFARVQQHSQDELGEIASAFNDMQEELEQQHTELINSEQRMRTLYHSTPSLLFSFNKAGMILDASDYFLNFLGYARQQLQGRPLHWLTPADQGASEADTLVKLLWQEGSVTGYALKIKTADNQILDVLIDATESGNITGTSALAVMTDVTCLRQAHRELNRQANTDMLSGLPNRNQFQRYLEQLTRKKALTQSPFALLFIDLDRFKSVNDTFGHQVGDELIRATARRINAELRKEDCLARLGGDEFAVVLEDLPSNEQAEEVARRILEKIEAGFNLADSNIYASASIGISLYPHDADNPTSLLQHADTAMYRAKEEGRSRYAFYRPEHNGNPLRRLRIENLLRRALEDQILELYYQPIINISEGKITGAEALLRLWDGNELISPDDFIPIAEETGLIVPIGAWCIEQTAEKLARWRTHFSPDFYLSVNVSTRQFQSSRFFTSVQDSIHKHQVPADQLLIEITESLLLLDNHNNQLVIEQLDKLGCRIVIDDFGTGYSALSYLMKFPLDTLKIDRSFITNCTDNQAHQGLVEAIIQMSQSMNLRVITEGIESQAQLALIQSLGGHCAQGYYFAKPMPADDFEAQWPQLCFEVKQKTQTQARPVAALASAANNA